MPDASWSRLWDSVRGAAGELAALRDEVALKAHLGGMEMRDLWSEIRPHVDQVEHRLREIARAIESAAPSAGTDEARLQWNLALMELRERWEALEPTLRALVDEARVLSETAARRTEAQERTLRELEQRVRGALVELKRVDAEGRHDLRVEAGHAGEAVAMAVRRAAAELKSAVHALAAR